MSTIDGDSSSECPLSHIACHSCRRRKIRCGRELPHCTVCERASQVCEYPSRVLKPGPKIGSTQTTSRKRRRADRANDDDEDDAKSNQLRKEKSRARKPSSQEENVENNGPEGSIEQTTSTTHPINIHHLSFILHPAHEDSTSEKDASPKSTASDAFENARDIVAARAAHALGVIPDVLEKMIKLYFENMTAINIFHEPTFEDKVRNIGSVAQVHALVAAVLAFSARFYGDTHKPAHFLELASRFADEALRECGDEAPPLCVLQALALIAHGQLTQGVRGKAWRTLGTCVRLAYELNLHLVDAACSVLDARESEEKRRVWWAIWEMDVFASTVRRCPAAVDWSQIETLLPIEDDYWFTSKPQTSCFFEPDPVQRWKALQESGNQSPKAWFIVINSLMKEAQSISSPRGIPNPSLPAVHHRLGTARSSKDLKHNLEEANEKLETLTNAVYCFVMALPPHLRYRNQYLGFDARQPGQTSSLRQHHCGIYNIHVMTELAKLMIHHYDIFGQTGTSGGSATPSRIINGNDNLAMNQYFEAADEILKIIRRSSDDHIKWINNFLSSTIWLASAVQLVHKEFGAPGTNRSLIKSKFEVLNMTYKKCVSFWGIQTAMQRNLETLESQLELFRISVSKKSDNVQQVEAHHRSPQTRRDSWTEGLSVTRSDVPDKQADSQPSNEMPSLPEDRISYDSRGSSNLCSHNQSILPDRSITPMPTFNFQDNQFQSHKQQLLPSQRKPQQPQNSKYNLAPLSPALSVLDYMYLSSQIDTDVQHQVQNSDGGMLISPSYTNDQEGVLYSAVQEGQSLGMDNDPLQGLSDFGMHMNDWEYGTAELHG